MDQIEFKAGLLDDNTEKEQALSRVILSAIFMVYVFFTPLLFSTPLSSWIIVTTLIYSVWCLLLLMWTYKKPHRAPLVRRVLSCVIDHASICNAFFALEKHALLLIYAPSLLNMGYALRFGMRWLLISTLLSLLSLIFLAGASNYFANYVQFMIGFAFLNMSVSLYVGYALENLTKLYASLQHQAKELKARATHDGLTGIANRNLFNAEFARIMSSAKRSGQELAVIYFDLDSFKLANDMFGHEAGDTILKKMASSIDATLRDHDLFARLGGDEFIIVLSEGNVRDGAVRLCDKIVKIAESIPDDKICTQLSASVGCVFYNNTMSLGKIDDLVASADKAMYSAKRSGKGQVHIEYGQKKMHA